MCIRDRVSTQSTGKNSRRTMSKSQLSGIPGYTGYIRPSLQCTQQSTLKPGRHCHQGGSYWPRHPKPRPLSLDTGRETLSADMNSLVSPESYKNRTRQDRPCLLGEPLTSPTCSHWKSIGADAYRVHTPPTRALPRPILMKRTQPAVLPSPTQESPQQRLTSTTQFKSMGSPAGALTRGSPRRRRELREGSREYLISTQDRVSRDKVDGTTKVTQMPPGYMGHIPHMQTNSPTCVLAACCSEGVSSGRRFMARAPSRGFLSDARRTLYSTASTNDPLAT
eukprot:TRINITY_DN9301_c0_g1_i1.p1 TRINITY_DN9301_c0_g1~~TRINITY_DN9301_c0_g1_i1.p1  ORF type:complete len:279 (-),score=16.29 TRINITY_DN9301_c0_g1_i1:526-1362(-)